MVEVKVILHSAITGESSEIANMLIVNDGSGDYKTGNYDVTAWHEPPPSSHRGRSVVRKRVERHPRRESIWSLIGKAIEALYRA